MFNNIAIIGFGLIGSSLARAIKAHDPAQRLVCIDRDENVCAKVMELGIADTATLSVAEGIQNCDLVIIAVPVGAFSDIGAQLRGNLAKGCIVTDVGSVKQTVIESLKPHIPDHACFVPGHPIAGTEFSGPEAGFAELFKGRWCILTPLPETPIRAVEKIVQLWESCGAMTEIMEPRHHDLVLAITSHLPHLIAYTIVGTATDLEDHLKAEVVKYSASGFRDFTRIAASDPVMWRDIFMNNRDAVLEILQRFNEDLTALQRVIRRGEEDVLLDFLSRTRDIRHQIIDVGQAGYAYPSGTQEGTPAATDPEKASGSAG